MTRSFFFATLSLVVFAVTSRPALAQCTPPSGYYASVDASSSASLRATLHAVIDDHTKIPYTSSSTDTWDVLEIAQRDPSDVIRILDVYKNESYPKQGGGNNFYQREHTWPNSYGFPNDGSSNYPYSDCHSLFLCNGSYNSARSNKPFRNCSASCTEYDTVFNNGNGGQGGGYPGDSNWSTGSFTSGTWEVWSGRRGDIARAMFYMDIRYEGGNHGSSGFAEPDLRLTDNQSLIASGNTGQNESVAYMGMLSVLLQWHVEDPPDADECFRNDMVWAFQGNRNPFIDHPEWVECIYSGICGDLGTNYCGPAVPNSSGNPAVISAAGSPLVSQNDFLLICEAMPANQFGYFLASETQAFIQNPGGSKGNLCLGGNIGRFSKLIQNTGVFGTMGITVDLTNIPTSPPSSVQPGETWSFQCWFRDNNGGPTSNFSDGFEVTFL